MARPAENSLARRLVCALTALLLLASPAAAQTMRGSLPSNIYFAAFRSYFDGDYERAMDAFRESGRLGRQSVDGRWVDGVCYHTMVGECLYRTGKLELALEQYNTAIRIFLRHRKWMQRVQFPDRVTADPALRRDGINWVRRDPVPGRFTDYSTLFGDLNAGQTLETGGVFARPELRSVHVAEIMRCFAISVKRRGQLLGPLTRYDDLNPTLVGALESNLVPLNHWSQAWVDVARGMVLSAIGKKEDANLAWSRGVLIQGYDHPLTALALLELGKSALAKGQAQAAGDFFLQASVSAASFEQMDLVAEAFEALHRVHMQSELLAPHPAFAPAIAWANRNRVRPLRTSLLVNVTEQLLGMNDTKQASNAFADATKGQGRRSRVSIQLAAHQACVEAALQFRQGKTELGEKALSRAVALQQQASEWQFKIHTANRMFRSGGEQLTPRTAGYLFETLLREPGQADWQENPLEAVVALSTPQPEAFESWFESALQRSEESAALEVIQKMNRHRFFAKLPLGGRLMALRWALEAPQAALDARTLARRDDLLVKFPDYATASRAARELKEELKRLPLDDDEATFKKRIKLSKRLAALADNQERILRDIALRREHIPFSFPPALSVKQIQSRLNNAQVVWGFSHQTQGLYAYMVSSKYTALWKVDRPQLAKKAVIKFLSDLGMRGPNQPVTVSQLSDDRWRDSARTVLDTILDNRQNGFWRRFEELIVVPDSFLWYLPFEATQVDDMVLIDRLRIRYVPLLALAASKQPLPQKSINTTALIGQLFPRESDDVTAEQFDQMQHVVDNLVALPEKLGVPARILRVTWERLLVLDDIDDAYEGPMEWSLGKAPGEKSGNRLASWLQLPWGVPDQIMLPGFHTAAEKNSAKGDGDEVFTALAALMSAGPRTVLLARWRTGGQSSYDLMREWLQECDVSSAAQAWQRAVQIVRSAEVDASWEPRVTSRPSDPTIKAEHPFFWAGYMLVDTGVGTPAPLPKRATIETASSAE